MLIDRRQLRQAITRAMLCLLLFRAADGQDNMARVFSWSFGVKYAFDKFSAVALFEEFTLIDPEWEDQLTKRIFDCGCVAFIDPSPHLENTRIFHSMCDLKSGMIYKKKCAEWFEKKADKSGSVVYFIQVNQSGPIKIGYSTSVSSRLESLRISSPYDLNLLGTIKGGKSAEQKLHKRFKHLHIRGEWFAPEKELIDYIESVTSQEGALQ